MKSCATLAAAALLGGLVIAPSLAGARDYDVGALHIGAPWIRATPNAAPTAAGYLTVTNRGATPDRLVGGSSPLARAVEPHTMSMAGGVMRMRLAQRGLEIAPGATLTLAPGGDHLMLVGPARALAPGERVPVTLRFAGAGAAPVEFEVRTASPRRSPMRMPK